MDEPGGPQGFLGVWTWFTSIDPLLQRRQPPGFPQRRNYERHLKFSCLDTFPLSSVPQDASRVLNPQGQPLHVSSHHLKTLWECGVTQDGRGEVSGRCTSEC